MFLCFVLFFKQKTAYEMRISDWSSDVCSSDLVDLVKRAEPGELLAHAVDVEVAHVALPQADRLERDLETHRDIRPAPSIRPPGRKITISMNRTPRVRRSEEHTSELQSLMRISYAVFCLKKKNKTTQQQTTN